MTDSELISAFKAGDIEALGVLMERYKAAVYGYLLSLTARPDAAADLFQEVFLKLVRNPDAYREKDKFKAWLFTVARNAAMDYFRRESSRRTESLTVEDGGSGEFDKAVSSEPGPQEAFEKKILGEKIGRALERLSPEQREVFYLRHYSELSFKEIAGMLGVPIGTVLARMSRAAAFLRKNL
jgi:RNA polymerase sigma-70 factor (ECF subfamily)